MNIYDFYSPERVAQAYLGWCEWAHDEAERRGTLYDGVEDTVLLPGTSPVCKNVFGDGAVVRQTFRGEID